LYFARGCPNPTTAFEMQIREQYPFLNLQETQQDCTFQRGVTIDSPAATLLVATTAAALLVAAATSTTVATTCMTQSQTCKCHSSYISCWTHA
jgi:hypothetical protein